MEYIGAQYFPGALTDCAASVLQLVSKSGVWMPDPRAVNSQQLRALLALRNAGYVEYAGYYGYKVKGNAYTMGQGVKPAQPVTAETVTAMLISAGIPAARIRKVLPVTTGAWKRDGDGTQWAVCLDRAGGLAGVDWSGFTELLGEGSLLVVRVKG